MSSFLSSELYISISNCLTTPHSAYVGSKIRCMGWGRRRPRRRSGAPSSPTPEPSPATLFTQPPTLRVLFLQLTRAQPPQTNLQDSEFTAIGPGPGSSFDTLGWSVGLGGLWLPPPYLRPVRAKSPSSFLGQPSLTSCLGPSPQHPAGGPREHPPVQRTRILLSEVEH